MTTKDDTKTTQVFDIRFGSSMATEAFLELREIPGIKSKNVWLLEASG